MAEDLAHVIMEQAMKYGRTVTFKAADAIATSSQGAAPQMVHIEVRPTEGGAGRISMVPTHAEARRQLGARRDMHLVARRGEELSKEEQ